MNRTKATTGTLCLSAVLLISACSTSDGASDSSTTPGPNINGDPTNATTELPTSQLSPTFELPEPEPKLLPFSTRLRKVAAVLGVDVSHPVLDSLRAKANELGGYDFAAGVLPDSNWTALKLSTWVQALKPVCQSAEFAALYPTLPGALPQLISAAHGRDVTEADQIAMQQALVETPASSPAAQSLVLCLTVLSSMEFVSR